MTRVKQLIHIGSNTTLENVQHISVTKKRKFFSLLRAQADHADEHWIYPANGISVGELCVAQVLENNPRSKTSGKRKSPD